MSNRKEKLEVEGLVELNANLIFICCRAVLHPLRPLAKASTESRARQYPQMRPVRSDVSKPFPNMKCTEGSKLTD